MRTPTSEVATRLALLFKRRLTTAWDRKEIRRLCELVEMKCFDTLDDLALIERYYAFERRKGDTGYHRRDLYTLLNNWHGELDRARDWRELHPVKPPLRKIIPMPVIPSEPYVAPSDPESVAALARFEEELRRRKEGRKG